VIAVAPRARRGEVLGSVLASAIFGTLVGPIVGTFAVAVGTKVVFSIVGAVSLALTLWTLRHPEPPRAALGAGAPLRTLVSSRQVMLGFWLVLLVACTMGAISALLPLRLSRFGASGVAIGITFVVAALLSTCLAPGIGRLLDRRGITLPLTAGLSATGVLLAALPLPAAALAFATMLLNLAWALGEMIGAPAAANLSAATSDTVPLVVLAVAMLLTLGPVLALRPLGGYAPAAGTASAE
jgi:hypothetical protein